MRFKEFILERYLTSEFKFGFEFECVITGDEGDALLRRVFKNAGISVEPVAKEDTSIQSKMYETREYTCGPLPVTPQNIKAVIEGLRLAHRAGFKTNKSCGFHVHTSWPHLDELNSCWVMVNLAFNRRFEKFIHFKDKFNFYNKEMAHLKVITQMGHDINSGTEKAHADRLDTIERYGLHSAYRNDFPTLEKERAKALKNLVRECLRMNGKYNVFHMHDLGTIEWRGPRDFMNNGANHIKDFFLFYLELINFFKQSLENKQVGWITYDMFKKEFTSEDNNGGPTWINKPDRLAGDRRFDYGIDPNEVGVLFKQFPWLGKCKFDGIGSFKVQGKRLYIWRGTMKSGRFTNTDFRGVYIEGGEYIGCTFTQCTIRSADVRDCQLDKTTVYERSIFSRTNFKDSDWYIRHGNRYLSGNTWESGYLLGNADGRVSGPPRQGME